MTEHSDFWGIIKAVAERMEHDRNMAGKTKAPCAAPGCKRGITEPGYTDYDGYGSIYRQTAYCRACGGHGFVEVACAPEVEAAAIKREIVGLRARLRKLEGKGR